MLTSNGIKQEASFIYLHALAAKLGYSLERTAIDMDSVDATICSRGKVIGSRGSLLSPKIDVQLKATERECSGSSIPFTLSKKNYDDLRGNRMVPKILVAFFLPKENDWFGWDIEQILIRGQAFWKCLKGMEESENTSIVTVRLFPEDRLTDTTVQKLMLAAANREEFKYASLSN